MTPISLTLRWPQHGHGARLMASVSSGHVPTIPGLLRVTHFQARFALSRPGPHQLRRALAPSGNTDVWRPGAGRWYRSTPLPQRTEPGSESAVCTHVCKGLRPQPPVIRYKGRPTDVCTVRSYLRGSRGTRPRARGGRQTREQPRWGRARVQSWRVWWGQGGQTTQPQARGR